MNRHMHEHLPRRSFSAALLALAGGALLTLSACGFQLRQPPEMAFRTVQLQGFASNSTLAARLAHDLEEAGVDVVSSTAQAAELGQAQGATGAAVLARHVVLQALRDTSSETVASKTAYGQVRDLTLRSGFRFQLIRPGGEVLIAPTDLLLSRDLTYDEKDALAKMEESAALHRAMENDIVGQVLRRLAVVRLDQLAPVEPAASASVTAVAPASAPAAPAAP